MKLHKTKTKGFTVIEILITVAIIGILASVILPQVKLARTKAEVAKAQTQIKQIRNALETQGGETGEWPGHTIVGTVDDGTGGNEVWDLTTDSAGLLATDGLFPNWNGPYIPDIPLDPWGNNYFFDTDYDVGSSTEIWVVVVGSFGPNGVGQNTFDSDDVYEIIERE